MRAKLTKLDSDLYFVMYRPSPDNWLRWTALTFSKSGNGGLYVILAILALAYLEHAGATFFSMVALAFLIERPLYFYLKNRIARPRPCDFFCVQAWLKPSDKFSLPSGHSAAAWLFATCMIEHIPMLTLPIIFWALGVSLSRVVIGVHYPLDILFGAIMGFSCASMAIILVGMI